MVDLTVSVTCYKGQVARPVTSKVCQWNMGITADKYPEKRISSQNVPVQKGNILLHIVNTLVETVFV